VTVIAAAQGPATVGGVEALSNLVAQFPEDLPATIFVVQHISPTAPGQLAQILDRVGLLPATMAQDCESFELGHIYVAPPDYPLAREAGLPACDTWPAGEPCTACH
jgi:two-component system chemotaxis response regulator CheB